MKGQLKEDRGFNSAPTRGSVPLWVSGGWILPLFGIGFWMLPAFPSVRMALALLAILVAPIPALLYGVKQRRRLIACAAKAEEDAAQLKLQLDTVRFRTTRLREELQAADRQARLSHQLTLLGQFTAGFMHEFNNPLAIVAGRIEVLLEERKHDAALCADLEQMLKETRYMGNIAGTLLQALRRERAGEVYEASAPQKALEDAMAALRPAAKRQGVTLEEEIGEAPRVDVPEPYRTAGARVVARIEDNGPGVPESIQQHLFEPFISSSTGRERLGLGLFLAASLLDMYDGRIRYEMRYGGGASFVIELPPARFTRGQPYHWFAGGTTE